jgi:hypothetical protein
LEWSAQYSYGLFARGSLPIAKTDTGDLVVLRVSEPGRGRIGFFDILEGATSTKQPPT